MKTLPPRVTVLRGAPRDWRPWRFADLDTYGGLSAQEQGDVRQAMEQGREQGYQQGLLDGREAGHAEGAQIGHDQGLLQGLEQGRLKGQEAFALAAQPLERILGHLREFAGHHEQQRREELLMLVGKVAQQVIRCELTLHPTQLLTLVDEALAALPVAPVQPHVLLNPEECARLRDLAPERASDWRLVPDERLALGECRIVTEHEEIDVGCQQRLDACLASVAQSLPVEKAP